MADQEDRKLRSQQWFGGTGFSGFPARSWTRNRGTPSDHFDGRPVIGICNTWSELTPCNTHFREIAEHVRNGVLEAGGVPLEFPVMSIGETYVRPTSMLHRNLASMDVEESIRANPLDGVVLLMGCDKTSPSLLMGAASVNLPTIGVSGGPMLNGRMRGKSLGIGDLWDMIDGVRAGTISDAQMFEAEVGLNRSKGHCNIMGTASTMASMVEALGVGMPGNAAIPAVDANRYLLARLAGRRIVDMVREDVTLDKLLTREAFENAVRVNAAIGGSTNAVIHLTAIARRIGVPLAIDDWDSLARGVPTLANLQPSGSYLMEDFYYAGGLPVVLRELGAAGLLHRDAITANGKTIWENNENAPCWNGDVIRSAAEPLMAEAGIAVLRGNLCVDGAVIKPSAADPKLLVHTGKAVVFNGRDDLERRINDPALGIEASSVLVLRNCGPRGYPGMPELGNLPIPAALLREGVRDMVRISDCRMSGTASGTAILHVSPEAAIGGNLALVRDGDLIELDVPARRLHLHVSDAELDERRASWTPLPAMAERGYTRLYLDHVNQAHDGADMDFLVGGSGSAVVKFEVVS